MDIALAPAGGFGAAVARAAADYADPERRADIHVYWVIDETNASYMVFQNPPNWPDSDVADYVRSHDGVGSQRYEDVFLLEDFAHLAFVADDAPGSENVVGSDFVGKVMVLR